MTDKPEKIVFKRATPATKEKIEFARAKPEKTNDLRDQDNVQPQPKPNYPSLTPAKNKAPAGAKGIQENLPKKEPENQRPRFTLGEGGPMKETFQPIVKKAPDKGHDH